MNTKIGDVWNSVPKEVDMQQHDWGVSEALRYRFTKELLGKASVSYDVRLPTDAELIGDGFLIAPSGDLKPERGTNANIGLMYDKKDWFRIVAGGGKRILLLPARYDTLYAQLRAGQIH